MSGVTVTSTPPRTQANGPIDPQASDDELVTPPQVEIAPRQPQSPEMVD